MINCCQLQFKNAVLSWVVILVKLSLMLYKCVLWAAVVDGHGGFAAHSSNLLVNVILWLAGAGQLWMERKRETQFSSQCGCIHTQIQPGMSYKISTVT